MEQQRAAAFPARGVGPGLVATAWIVVAGCVTSQPRPPLPLQAAPALASVDGLERSDRWWQDFDDPGLSKLIELALASDFTLQAAYERLREARASAGLAQAARAPTLDARASGTQVDGSDEDWTSEISFGLEASYEVDLWGRIRSNVEAARLEATATAEDYQVAAVSLSAEVARTRYQLAEASAQLTLLDAQLRTNRDVLLVIENRFAIGQSGSVDVLRQRQLVAATTEQQILTRAAIEMLEHQLLVLLGAPPQGQLPLDRPWSLPEVARLPEVGLPTDLLQRRPDVRAAYWRLESADASVAAAVKDQYPTFNLGGVLTTAAENPSGLFDGWLASLTEQLLAPLVDGGRRRRAVERAEAVRGQRLAEYGETVLTAFREVEDALVQERYLVERIASLDQQLALASTAYTELRNQYLNGAADFIDVLVALRDQQELERSVLAARLGRIEQRIALHRAIAGGFVDTIRDAAPSVPDADDSITEGMR